MCNLCNQDVQTIEHLFWNCVKTRHFWDDFLETLHQNCPHTQRFQLKEDFILFGSSDNIETDGPIDFMILLAKFYIYKCMLQTVEPTYVNFLYLLKAKYAIENASAYRKACHSKFSQSWYPYLPLMS